MKDSDADFISIITLNYNGKHYLKEFLDSAVSLDYPKDKYEIIVVDNASTDDSVDYVRKYFRTVRVIESRKNLGFGGGNNLGMKNARGELFFLVNNDTILGKDSLGQIVSTYHRWSKRGRVGAVNSKLLLIDSYLPLIIKNANLVNYSVPSGFTPKNKDPFVLPQKSKSSYIEELLVPINHNKDQRLRLRLSLKPLVKDRFVVSLKRQKVAHKTVGYSRDSANIELNISKELLAKSRVNLIQNAGSFYFRDGHGRDRGAFVMRHRQYYEVDNGQYQKEEQIMGFCGAGVLLNKKALDKVGYFDEKFFMYYEDADLSFRLRENGWKIVYSPKSEIRHIHSGSSKEWSQFFVYQVERSRLIFVAKHWPRILALKQWLKYVYRDTLSTPLYYLYKGDIENAYSRFLVRAKVNVSLLVPLASALSRNKRLTSKQVEKLI